MSWEHDMAREFQARNNREQFSWFSGRVESPVQVVDPETGAVSYEGPLIVSAFDGQVMLREDRLRVLAHLPQVFQGQTVALAGSPFSKAAGSQKILLLGVI